MTENKEEERLVVKRVIKAEVWIMLDDHVLKALSNNIPVNFTLSEEENKVVKEAMRTKGTIELNLIRKKGKDE